MSKHRLRAGLCFTGFLLAGCAGAPPAAPQAAAVAPVHLLKYDGNYQGRARLVSAPGAACPAAGYGVVTVGDQTVNFAYLPDVVFVAPVADDGSIHDVSGPATLDGKITGGTLSMTVKTPGCESTYQADVIWNHA